MRVSLLAAVSLPALFLLAGCAEETDAPQPEALGPTPAVMPPIRTQADSIALQAYEAWGGPEAWAALPYLRFDFGVERDGERQFRRKHLWSRHTGDYRVEWNAGQDSTYVALFDTDTRDGQVYLNGAPVDSTERDDLLASAYRAYINDTYWLMAPIKMLDPGVTRTYEPDSSTADRAVVRLSFDDVGLTPGDRYWMYVNRETGRVERWAFILENMPPEGPARSAAWTGYQALETPAGTLHVATRKESGGLSALLTDQVAVPETVPDDMFTDPNPRL